MRQLVHDALADAREMVGDVVRDLRQDAQLSDDEVLARYETHRGDPWALMGFVKAQTGLTGEAALGEALRYEREMERLWRNQQS